MSVLSQEELSQLFAGKSQSIIDFYKERNEQPLKSSGTIAYIYKQGLKGKVKEGAIMVFFHWELWPERNLRHPGVKKTDAFITRPMIHEELIEEHFNTRLRYTTYNSWDALIDDERIIVGESFANQLIPFKNKYEQRKIDKSSVSNGTEATDQRPKG